MGEKNGYRQWITPTPRAVFLLVHGLGAHTGRWESMAEFFLQKDISSYAPELEDFNTSHNDILRVYHLAAKENPGKKIFLIGESLGGLISLFFAIDNPGLFNGLVCLSPAFSNRLTLPPLDYMKIFFSLFYDQRRKFNVPFDSSMCTRDVEYRKKMDADERERRSASAIVLTKIVMMQSYLPLVKNRLKTPALFMYAGEDKIVDQNKTIKIFNSLALQDKTLIGYPGMYHSLSIDIGREKVFGDVLQWIDKRI